MAKFWHILLLCSALSIPRWVHAQELEIDNPVGIYDATLETAAGTVKVYLPDGLASGDTLSGTIVLVPKGEDEDEKNSSRKELSKYSLELEKDKKSLAAGAVKWTIPAGVTRGAVFMVLRNKSGEEVGRAAVPVRARANDLSFVVNPSLHEYACPKVGSEGIPAVINGPFDGDFSTTKLNIGGKPVKLIAESPRKLVFLSPIDVVGPTQIELKERSVLVRKSFHNLRVMRIDGEKLPVSKVKPRKVTSGGKFNSEKKKIGQNDSKDGATDSIKKKEETSLVSYPDEALW